MNSKRPTLSEYEQMTWPQRYAAFCQDEWNFTTNDKASGPGLTVANQAALFNSWQDALFIWSQSLSTR